MTISSISFSVSSAIYRVEISHETCNLHNITGSTAVSFSYITLPCRTWFTGKNVRKNYFLWAFVTIFAWIKNIIGISTYLQRCKPNARTIVPLVTVNRTIKLNNIQGYIYVYLCVHQRERESIKLISTHFLETILFTFSYIIQCIKKTDEIEIKIETEKLHLHWI